MRYSLFCISIFLFSSCCWTCNNSEKEPEVQYTAQSSASFKTAKYLTELSYITKDRAMIQTFYTTYKDGTSSAYPSLWKLNAWSTGKNPDIVIDALELFLKLEPQGQ